jgi:NitT/TauT family transport system substrate-binding protein
MTLRQAMTLRHAVTRVAVALIVVGSIAGAAQAQTALKLSLDDRLEGPAALFLLPQDRGYYRSEGLDVTVEEGASALEPITRVASGGYELGFADINALIRYRDQNPAAPVKAVFMLYSKPPFAIVGRKSRGISDPKSLEDKKLGAPPTGASFDQWPIFAKLNDIDPAKVAVEKISVPVLLFIGDKEKMSIVSLEAGREAARVNDKVQVVHLEGASHDIRRTRFDGYMPALQKFLGEIYHS